MVQALVTMRVKKVPYLSGTMHNYASTTNGIHIITKVFSWLFPHCAQLQSEAFLFSFAFGWVFLRSYLILFMLDPLKGCAIQTDETKAKAHTAQKKSVE